MDFNRLNTLRECDDWIDKLKCSQYGIYFDPCRHCYYDFNHFLLLSTTGCPNESFRTNFLWWVTRPFPNSHRPQRHEFSPTTHLLPNCITSIIVYWGDGMCKVAKIRAISFERKSYLACSSSNFLLTLWPRHVSPLLMAFRWHKLNQSGNKRFFLWKRLVFKFTHYFPIFCE